MEQETAGNRIIMFFDGAEVSQIEILGDMCDAIKYKESYYPIDRNLPKFNEDWNLIMPVVEKIEGLGYRFKQCRKRVVLEHDRQPSVEGNYEIFQVKGGSKIQSAWKAVVRFIEWFNSQQIIKKEV